MAKRWPKIKGPMHKKNSPKKGIVKRQGRPGVGGGKAWGKIRGKGGGGGARFIIINCVHRGQNIMLSNQEKQA